MIAALWNVEGVVERGFGRGSKQLGFPTANLPLNDEVRTADTGVYAVWVHRANGTVYKGAANVGWSPYFANQRKTVEVHLLAAFDDDFYGEWLRVVAVHRVRAEANFDSLDALRQAIADDIVHCAAVLDQPAYAPDAHVDYLHSGRAND